MSYTADRESFIARIRHEVTANPADTGDQGRPSFPAVLDIARAILRDAATHYRLAEQDCNVGLTEAQARRSDACERRILARCAELGPGFGAVFSGDPRGATVKITLPSGYSDSWGGEGLCVPVRG